MKIIVKPTVFIIIALSYLYVFPVNYMPHDHICPDVPWSDFYIVRMCCEVSGSWVTFRIYKGDGTLFQAPGVAQIWEGGIYGTPRGQYKSYQAGVQFVEISFSLSYFTGGGRNFFGVVYSNRDTPPADPNDGGYWTQNIYITACQTPTANFYGSPTSGNAPLSVQFFDQSSPGSGASITGWYWEFGDGATSSSNNPNHTYSSPGSYTVRLKVTNSCGIQDTETKYNYIYIPPATPIANFYGSPTSGNVPLSVQFYDQSSPGSGASLTSWYWEFGDGGTSSSNNPNHAYNSPGLYTVNLRVINSYGNQDTEIKYSYINVTDSAPTANFYGSPTSGNAPLSVQFFDQSSPGSGASITSWYWEFGDGATSSSNNPNHTYSSSGLYSVSLRVTNSYGKQNTKTMNNYINVSDGILAYRLPFPSGTTMDISCGYDCEMHTAENNDQYCVDFNIVGDPDAGIPVLAVADGTVTFAGWKNNAYGYRVVVDHGNEITSNYSHGAAINVKQGDFVRQGQELMVLWKTGTDNYHLHFGMRKNGISMELPEFSGCTSGCTLDPINPAGYTSDNVVNNPGKIIEENQAELSGQGFDGNEILGHNHNYSWKYAIEGTPTTTAIYRPRFSQNLICEVSVYIPFNHATTTAAKYKVKHVGGEEIILVDQSEKNGKLDNWCRLGTFEFGIGDNYYVQVGNDVGDYKPGIQVGFDAVYFKKKEGGGGSAITITSPNGGENLAVGSSHAIKWDTTGVVGSVKIEFSINNGAVWSTIVSSTANNGTYSWIVPSSVSSKCLIRMRDTDGSPSDVSNGVFGINIPIYNGNDFTGDNKADIAVYRASNGYWYIMNSPNIRWGIQDGDVPVPGDYNGDGTTDIAVYRNSNGYWYIRGVGNHKWGIQAGDIPVPGDYNKDGKTDIAVYRPSNGYWYIKGVGNYRWGIQQGDVPVPGDYNGDNQTDIAVYRPSNGYWYIKGIGNYQWGIQSGDIPVPGDYDGNGTTDIAIYRHSDGYWYIKGGSYVRWGIQSEDIPVQADYNGDGKFEIAVFRPSNGTWYIKGIGNYVWGIQAGDIPVTRGGK